MDNLSFYKPKYFKVHELVDHWTYEKYGDGSLKFLDPRILITIDNVRAFLGKPITVNNWKWGGPREWSGLRTPKSPYYSRYSQHTHGRAIDFLVSGMTPAEVDKKILDNSELFPYLTRMEKDRPTWTHIDCANNDYDGIYVFNP